MTVEQLQFLRFPLGELAKDETRAHAQRLRLPVADKPDSQDICFVPEGSYAGVVDALRPGAAEPGDIVDVQGNVVGRHEGLIHYTVGQRRGLGIAAPEPLYVVRLEPRERRVVVGPRPALLKDRLGAYGVNWLGAAHMPDDPIEVRVKLRSAQEPVPATVRAVAGDGAEVVLDEAQAGVAPGQACVFYDGERVLGGGWIARQDAAAGLQA